MYLVFTCIYSTESILKNIENDYLNALVAYNNTT